MMIRFVVLALKMSFRMSEVVVILNMEAYTRRLDYITLILRKPGRFVEV